MLALHAPTLPGVVHHDWSRKFFVHQPADPILLEHIGKPYIRPGKVLDVVCREPGGLREAILVAHAGRGRTSGPSQVIWHGPTRIRQETFLGLFGARYQRIRPEALRLLRERCPYFLIVRPRTDPAFVIPLPSFAKMGVSPGVLEEALGAPVILPDEGPWAAQAYLPSLRVYAEFDGTRYGSSTRKLFYDQRGRPVPVEFLAREVLQRLGYQVVPPVVFQAFFLAIVGRPASHFLADYWPAGFLAGRVSPLEWAARAQERIAAMADAGPVSGTLHALETLAQRPPYREWARPGGALPIVSRFLTRDRLRVLLETIGEDRYVQILQGAALGYHVVSADWFAFMPGTRRVFPCEVKARGDHLRPYQKESALFNRQRSLLDYRLLEILHGSQTRAVAGGAGRGPRPAGR